MAREQFPGKASSLDALCRRLEVDNSSGTSTAPCWTPELVAEVYIRLTRGPGRPAGGRVGGSHARQASSAVEAVDLSSFVLPVLAASKPSAPHTPRCWPTSTRLPAAQASGASWNPAKRGIIAGSRGRIRVRAVSSAVRGTAFTAGVAGSNPLPPTRSPRYRAVSSAVEHCLHTAGVAGSNPAPPTK